jgi:hypothetical protein
VVVQVDTDVEGVSGGLPGVPGDGLAVLHFEICQKAPTRVLLALPGSVVMSASRPGTVPLRMEVAGIVRSSAVEMTAPPGA